MSQQMPTDLVIGYGLVALCQKTSARSGWIQHRAHLIDSNLPFAEQRVEQLTTVVNNLSNQYLAVGRTMETLFFGFDQHFVLIVSEGDLCLGLLFPKDMENYDDSIPASRRFLRKNRFKILEDLDNAGVFIPAVEPETQPASIPEPEVCNLWPEIELKIKDLLGRVLNSRQADQLIERTLANDSIPENPDAIQAMARQIISKVPHRGKQKALLAELKDILHHAGLS